MTIKGAAHSGAILDGNWPQAWPDRPWPVTVGAAAELFFVLNR